MNKIPYLFLAIIIVSSFILSCERVTTSTPGELQTVKLSNLKGVPLAYGSLISVTAPSGQSRWAHLWFADKDQTIRMVRVGFADNRVHEKATVIPRY